MALLITSLGYEVTPYGLRRVVVTFDNGKNDIGPWLWPTQERREKFRRVDARGNRRKH